MEPENGATVASYSVAFPDYAQVTNLLIATLMQSGKHYAAFLWMRKGCFADYTNLVIT